MHKKTSPPVICREQKHKARSVRDVLPSLGNRSVTECKLLPLAARQAGKSRDKALGQGAVTLFRKPADGEDGGLVSQRTIFPDLEFRTLLHWKGNPGSTSLRRRCVNSFLPAAVHRWAGSGCFLGAKGRYLLNAHYLGSRVRVRVRAPRDGPLCVTEASRRHPFSDELVIQHKGSSLLQKPLGWSVVLCYFGSGGHGSGAVVFRGGEFSLIYRAVFTVKWWRLFC